MYRQNKLSDSPTFSRIHLLAMKKRNLKQTVILLHESLNDAENSLCTQWYSIPLDIIDSKILKPPTLVKKKTPPICKIFFDNKKIEKIYLSHIFHDPLVKLALPKTFHFDISIVVYTNALGSKFLT